MTLDLAPVVDVVPAGTVNAPIGAFDRQYGGTPRPVATDGAAFVRGMRAAGVATSIQHFPGLGRARARLVEPSAGSLHRSAVWPSTVYSEAPAFGSTSVVPGLRRRAHMGRPPVAVRLAPSRTFVSTLRLR